MPLSQKYEFRRNFLSSFIGLWFSSHGIRHAQNRIAGRTCISSHIKNKRLFVVVYNVAGD